METFDREAIEELDQLDEQVDREDAEKLYYYQVLIDNRDVLYAKNYETELSFLIGNDINNRMVSYIRGIDYVSQNDIMPYTSTESVPVMHDLFNRLFHYLPNKSKNL